MLEALKRGDYEAGLELFAEDVVWHLPGRGPVAGDHEGKGAVLAAMRRFEKLSGGRMNIELHDVLGNEEHVAVLLRATGERGEKRYDALEVDVYHVRDGLIREFWSIAEDQVATDEFWSG
jgi:ketosteroid isomerase-like protein